MANGDGTSKRQKDGRFNSPHSGNPKGRPRKPHNLSTALNRALTKMLLVRAPSGECRTARALEVIAAAVVTKAASGDLRAFRVLNDLCAESPDSGEPGRFVTYAEQARDGAEVRRKLDQMHLRFEEQRKMEEGLKAQRSGQKNEDK